MMIVEQAVTHIAEAMSLDEALDVEARAGERVFLRAQAMREGVEETLNAGYSVNVLGLIDNYNALLGYGRDKSNAKVILRNAVLFPETFSRLASYDTQRQHLARTLHNIGVFGPEGVDVIIAMDDPHSVTHHSDDGTARRLEEDFNAYWQAA